MLNDACFLWVFVWSGLILGQQANVNADCLHFLPSFSFLPLSLPSSPKPFFFSLFFSSLTPPLQLNFQLRLEGNFSFCNGNKSVCCFKMAKEKLEKLSMKKKKKSFLWSGECANFQFLMQQLLSTYHMMGKVSTVSFHPKQPFSLEMQCSESMLEEL